MEKSFLRGIDMKKMIALLVLLLLVFSTLSGANTRVSSIGSNPYFSYIMFPQDVRQWSGNFMYYYPRYEKKPWWGDIDEPNRKPNPTTYTVTGIDEIDEGASFEHSGKIHSVDNQIGYTHWFRENFITSIDLNYNVNAMQNRADGSMSSEDSNNVLIEYIPFDYSLQHNMNDLSIGSIMGFNLGNIPVGLKLRFEYENTLALKQDFSYTKNGVDHSTERAVWGWATVPCAHIFGAYGVEGDAWLQTGYSQGPLYQLDMQTGFDLSRIRTGLLVHYKFGHQDQFKWDTANISGDTLLEESFTGSYVKGSTSKKTNDLLIQLYGNVNWRKGERYALNTFIGLDYEGRSFSDAASENLEIEKGPKEKRRHVSVEFNPNINLRLGEFFHYIDAALLLEYGYSRLYNTYERWVDGGYLETYWDEDVIDGDEVFWEQFSYANENFFDVGVDISAMFPLISKETGYLGFGFMLLFDTKFTFLTKYYGQNTVSGSELTFTVHNRRENFTREIWFNSALMLQVMKRPFHIRLQVTEPFLYSLMPRTRITDKDGKNVSYEHRKDPLWLSQQGFGVGLFFAYEMTLPFLR